MSSALPYLSAGSFSFLACCLLVLTKGWHGRFSLDSHHGVQRAHVAPTPRVGGVAIFVSLVVADLFVAGTPAGALLTPILLAGVPAFSLGLIEDLFKRGNIIERLGGTFVSAVLAWWLMEVSLRSVGVVGFDSLLELTLVSVAFTAFAVAGIANAVNIIDGFNGLASGAVALSMLGFAAIAFQVGDLPLAQVALLFAAAVAGFMLMNFPFGKIFLGDGGAYFLGFALGWMAVLLSSRNPQVSPWACFLVCGYPIIETLFSIVRRVKRQAHFGHPDRLHLHSLVRARWVQRHWGRWPAVLRNSMTSLPMWAYAASLVLAASVWYDQPQLMLLSVFAAAAFYWVWYLRLVRFGREYRIRA